MVAVKNTNTHNTNSVTSNRINVYAYLMQGNLITLFELHNYCMLCFGTKIGTLKYCLKFSKLALKFRKFTPNSINCIISVN